MSGFLASFLGFLGIGRAETKIDDFEEEPLNEAAIIEEFRYKVVTVPGALALSEWEKLRGASDGYPVIVGDTSSLAGIADGLEFAGERTPDDIIAKASSLDFPDAIFAMRKLAREQFAKAYPQYADEIEFEPTLGEWPVRASPSPELTVHRDALTEKIADRVHIVIVPTTNGYEVPAYLAWGGWNDNPMPEYHVAALRSWEKRYGTELVGITSDVLNLRSSNRPKNREEAIALANEHYAYCSDIVDQGAGTLSELAASYLKSDWWYFWWD